VTTQNVVYFLDMLFIYFKNHFFGRKHYSECFEYNLSKFEIEHRCYFTSAFWDDLVNFLKMENIYDCQSKKIDRS
jgi:hypothetical protein